MHKVRLNVCNPSEGTDFYVVGRLFPNDANDKHRTKPFGVWLAAFSKLLKWSNLKRLNQIEWHAMANRAGMVH